MEHSAASKTLRRGRAEARAPTAASRRRCYNEAAPGCGFADCGCASEAPRASTASPAAFERRQTSEGAARLMPDFQCGESGWRAGAGAECRRRPRAEGGVGAGGSAAKPPVSRPGACVGARSWRMVALGRRIARGGWERRNQTVSDRSERMGAVTQWERRRAGRVSETGNISGNQRRLASGCSSSDCR